MSETLAQFEQRKKDHIRIALDPQSQARGLSGLDRVRLIHEALPEINFSQVKISTQFLNQKLRSPIFISSMTAGHEQAGLINLKLARAAARHGWMMGVGSQRKELTSSEATQEWKKIRQEMSLESHRAVMIGNLGLTQVIQTPVSQIQKLVDSLEASALFVHTNPLQEALQKEGTPHFQNGLKALENLCKEIEIPVILKEVGCGFSQSTFSKIRGIGLYGVDVAGLGGTHWGRIEGLRNSEDKLLFEAAKTFENWGISTVESLLMAREMSPDYCLWASGGVRSGLDVAKLLALGAEKVGVAQPILVAALSSTKIGDDEALDLVMQRLELELQIAMFCTGCDHLEQLSSKKVWTWT